MIRFLSLFLLCLLQQTAWGDVLLRKGTPVFVRLTTPADSNTNHPVRAEVAYDLVSEGSVVIPAGTVVELDVHRTKAKSIGKPGYLQIGCIATRATDNQTIHLTGVLNRTGENREGTAIGLGVGLGVTVLPGFGLFFLYLKGEQARVEEGTLIYGVTVADNYTIHTSSR